MPTKATSTSRREIKSPRRRHSARGSAASPSMKWNAPGWTRPARRSLRYLRKLAGCDSGRPTYSSRWKRTTWPQSIPAAPTSASRNSNCETPVAATTRASPRSLIASRIIAAASRAAASPISRFESKTSTFIGRTLLQSHHSVGGRARHHVRHAQRVRARRVVERRGERERGAPALRQNVLRICRQHRAVGRQDLKAEEPPPRSLGADGELWVLAEPRG